MILWWSCGCRYHAMWIRAGSRHRHGPPMILELTLPSTATLFDRSVSGKSGNRVPRPQPVSKPDMLRILSSSLLPKSGVDEPPFYYRPNRKLVAYDSSLTATSKQAELNNAEHLVAGTELGRMLSKRIRKDKGPITPTLENLSSMIDKSKGVSEIASCFRVLSTQSVHIPPDLLNKVVAYVTVHSARVGQQIMSFVDEGAFSQGSYTSELYITALIRGGNMDIAMEVYRGMKDKGFSSSTMTFYDSLLSALITSNADVGASKWKLVEDVIDGIRGSKLKPTIATFNMIMELACDCHKNPSKFCLNLVREMKSLKIAPSLGSYYFVLHSHRRRDNGQFFASVAKEILPSIMNELQNGEVEIRVRHYSDKRFFDLIMDAAVELSCDDVATAIYKIVEEGELFDLTNKKFVADHIGVLAKTKPDWDMILQRYRGLNCTPNAEFYHNIFRGMQLSENVTHLPLFANDFVRYHQPSEGKENSFSNTADTMFEALRNCIIAEDRLEEYLIIAENVNSLITEKTSKREYVISQLTAMCYPNKNSNADQKIKEHELTPLPAQETDAAPKIEAEEVTKKTANKSLIDLLSGPS